MIDEVPPDSVQVEPIVQTEFVKVEDLSGKPLPAATKTARFQQEVIQSLSGNTGSLNLRELGSTKLPAQGYQPNFNFSESTTPNDLQNNQYMAFQMRNKDLF